MSNFIIIFQNFTEQMHLVRRSTKIVNVINDPAKKMFDVKRRLARHVRNIEKAQRILFGTNEKKKGRTFGARKNNDLGYFWSRWINKSSVLGYFWCRWIDKNSGLEDLSGGGYVGRDG